MPSSAGSYASVVDRIDFSNDNTTTSPRGNLDRAIAHAGATGNASYGWWAGGSTAWNQPDTTSVSRIDYASDSSTASPKGTLSEPIESNTATGNKDYGYNIVGGPTGPSTPSLSSTIVRYDYASDTGASTPKGSLSVVRYDLAGATGSQEYGYFMGGYNPNTAPPYFTTVDRIDYSNDTATASPKGNLDQNAAGPSPGGYRKAGGFSGQSNGFGGAPSPASFVRATEIEANSTPQGTDFGYFGGGYTPSSPVSTVDRVDYSNDTATAAVKGPLHYSQYGGTATGNASYGYWGGGSNPSGNNLTLVSRFDYAADTSTAVSKGSLAAGRGYLSGAGNVSYGYYGAGFKPGPSPSTTVQRIDFANDTATAAPKGPINQSVSYIGSTGTQSYGYWAGGGVPDVSTISRVDYASDTGTASPKGPLSAARRGQGATGNASYAYFAGGSGGSPWVSSIDRLDYASDTSTASPKGNRSGERFVGQGGTGNQSYGYNAGGGTPMSSIMDRIDYANDTATAATKGPLSAQRNVAGAISPRDYATPTASSKTVDKGSDGYQVSSFGPAYGYLAGGAGISNVQRIDYASDTSTPTLKPNLPSEQSKGGGAGNLTHGYTFGGDAPSSSSKVYRLDYSNDAVAAVSKGNLSAAGNYMNSVGNANYGYSGGRHNPTNGTLIDKLDYSNDTEAAVALPVGMTPGAVHGYSTTGNQSFGYFIGGLLVPAMNTRLSNVRRLDYSNDTVGTSLKGPLTGATQYSTATGNANFGYTFVGAGTAGTKIDRIEYANDTATAVTKGNLTQSGYMRSATGSADFGYFCGGIPTYTKVDRIDYSNDTSTASTRGNLSVGTRHMQPFSAQQSGLFSQSYIPRVRFIDITPEIPATEPTPAGPAYGYAAGGMSPSYGTYTQVQRIDFANDTATTAAKGFLSSEHAKGGGTGSNSYGYCLGGDTPYPSSTVHRSDYANDTGTASTKGPLSAAGIYVASIGNINYGYTGGRLGSPGFSVPNNFSILDRVDYSNDTATATVPNATGFSPASNSYGGVGNQSYGYFAGGYDNPYGDHRSTVRRLDYSNDSATTSPKGPLNFKSANIAATGNADYGWNHSVPYGNSGSTINRIDYANDTATASPRGNLNNNGSKRAATGSANYGYFTGGIPTYSNVERIDYANDSATSSPKGSLVYVVRSHQAFSAREYGLPQSPTSGTAALQAPYQPPFPFPVQLYNKRRYGYFAGGYSTVPSSTVLSQTQRIDFTNDTATAVLKGNLTIPGPMQSDSQSGTGSPNHGYIAGGNPASTNADRIDYANDTATATLKSNVLTVAASRLAAVGNASYGYFAGGAPGTKTQVSRLDYSNDGGGGVSKGNLSTSGTGKTGVGNQSYGYVSGGIFKTTVDRIDYANDTATATPKGPLAAQGYARGAAGNTSFGYFAGGSPETVSGTNIQRIDYANDSNTALLKGTISESKYYLAGTGDQSYGYFGGGREAGDPSQTDIPSTSKIERIDFANDTATASPKGPLAIAFRQGAAVSAAANANP